VFWAPEADISQYPTWPGFGGERDVGGESNVGGSAPSARWLETPQLRGGQRSIRVELNLVGLAMRAERKVIDKMSTDCSFTASA